MGSTPYGRTTDGKHSLWSYYRWEALPMVVLPMGSTPKMGNISINSKPYGELPFIAIG